MSSGIKSLVRSAREAIDRGDYATALRLCDTGLAMEEEPSPQHKQQHYLLHVFRAVALQNLGQTAEAAETYRLATALQPQLAPAWQVFWQCPLGTGLTAFLPRACSVFANRRTDWPRPLSRSRSWSS